MEGERYRRPPRRDFTTVDIAPPSPSSSTLSGSSQKPHSDDFLSRINTPRTTGSLDLRFRTEWTGSGACSPVDTTLDAPDETLRCPVCNDSMITPKTLPCLHNCCKMCLQQHILKELRESIQSDVTPTSFPCPVCKRETKPPAKNVGCEKWAGLFPTNYFLHAYGMILQVQKQEVDCEPCLRRGEVTMATWWCRECSEYQCNVCKTVHSGFKIFKHHDVVDVKDIAENPDIAIPKFEPCNDHKEIITHFCQEHRVPCCATCLMSTHRKCDHVTTVEEEFKALKGKGGIKHLANKLQKYEESVNDLIETRRNIVDDLEARRQTIIETVRTIRETFEENLKQLETKLLTSFEKVHEEEIEKLRKYATDCENLGKQISNAVKLIDKVQQSGNEAHKISLVERVKQECRSYKTALTEQRSKLQHIDYDFRIDHNIENAIKTAKMFGTVSIKKSNKKVKDVIKSNKFHEGKYEEIGRLNVWIANDRGRCEIVGGHYFDDGRILVADCYNFKLKLFASSGRHLSHLVVKSRPNDITLIDKQTFVVCYPHASGIQFVQLDGNVFKNGNYVSTRRVYRRLSYVANYLYMLSNTGIAVCDKEGKEMNFINFKDKGIPAFSPYASLKATFNGLVVTDPDKNSVNFLSFDGCLQQTYSTRGMISPGRIGVDGSGTIFVCCRNDVYQFTESGHMVKVVAFDNNGVDNPMAIVFQTFGCKFFISDEKISNRDIIHFFEWN